MGKRRAKETPPRRPRWWWVAFGGLALIVAGVALAWWHWELPDAVGGTPRLVLDREVVDLGVLPFEAPARVVFTLTNAGNGPLRLAEVPRVKALKGC